MSLPPGLQDQALNGVRRRHVALAVATLLLAASHPGPALFAQSGPAVLLKSIDGRGEPRETRPDILDTALLPGSLMKAVTLVAALESQVIAPETARLCRRTVSMAGRSYTCAHPDLKRPLTAAEALAHSCNDFFVSLAPRLTRAAFNHVRTRIGLPAVNADANLPASFVGLDGPRITPRVMLDAIVRLTGVAGVSSVAGSETARRVLREGLRGAADYGTAAALRQRRIAALAKTGTAPMPGGSFMGLTAALTPSVNPQRAIIVVAPGVAGADAAAIAADWLSDGGREASTDRDRRSGGSLDPPSATSSQTPRVADADHSPWSGRSEDRPSQKPTVANPDGPLRNGRSKDRPLQGTGKTALVPPPGPTGPSDRPSLRISINGRVTTLDLESYVARVVAGEGQPKAGDAAQQALAVTARTFALANLGRHRREGYDMCDSTHCQVLRAATPTTQRAVEVTVGRVLTHRGQPATVFYSALCGGTSELASEVWPGAVDYASDVHRDDACRGEPGWSSELRASDVERALRAAGLRGNRLRDLRVLDRNSSGRVRRLRAEGFTPTEVTAHDFRMAVGRLLGWQHLKSTAFGLERTSAGYRFVGTGFGHGVGLCVIGAGHRAARGETADDILSFYFPRLSVGAPTRLIAAPPTKPSERGDVAIVLPVAEQRQRSEVVDLVRRARDEIAARAGVTAPVEIRVTVHPTVEAFARATGQPWWVSGSTDGRSIELLPLSILRKRGQIERTIRHEVAHLLIDATLKGRPLWVREGAAFYFADPTAASPSVSGACPPDAAFLKPLSAGAHRAAYARAEACFRRALSQGKRWQDVR